MSSVGSGEHNSRCVIEWEEMKVGSEVMRLDRDLKEFEVSRSLRFGGV